MKGPIRGILDGILGILSLFFCDIPNLGAVWANFWIFVVISLTFSPKRSCLGGILDIPGYFHLLFSQSGSSASSHEASPGAHNKRPGN
jgi:hypothetical protein